MALLPLLFFPRRRPRPETIGLRSIPLTPSNRTALLAAREAAREPGGLFNPLLLLGPSGCGKSRLLAALASEFRERGLSTCLASVTSLSRAFSRAAREGSLDRFERGILRFDALLLDDAERLAGRRRFARAVASLVETFLHRRRPFAGACRVHPRAAPGFDPRLGAILDSGFVAVFAPPHGAERASLEGIAEEAARGEGTLAHALSGRGRSRVVARARAGFVGAALRAGFAPTEVGRFLAGRSPSAIEHLARRARLLGRSGSPSREVGRPIPPSP